MKIRCNVCGGKEIIELPNPETKEEGFTVYCPDCGKLLADVDSDFYEKHFWHLYDSEYSESYGCKPVEVVEY